MAKKVFLQDLNEKLLPITRGELVLDSSGKEAFHSDEFLANDSLPGLMSKEDKIRLSLLSSIPIIEGNESDEYGHWTGLSSDITEYYDGLTIIYIPFVAGTVENTYLKLNQLDETKINILENNYESVIEPYTILGLVFNNGSWNTTDFNKTFKVKQTYVSSPNSTGAATEFIDTITQNNNGEITATKKYIPNATTSSPGIVQVGNNLATDDNGVLSAIGYKYDIVTKSFAAGENINTATGDYSFSEGNGTIASGKSSHAEGTGVGAIGEASHAEGWHNIYSANSAIYTVNQDGTDNTKYHIVSDFEGTTGGEDGIFYLKHGMTFLYNNEYYYVTEVYYEDNSNTKPIAFRLNKTIDRPDTEDFDITLILGKSIGKGSHIEGCNTVAYGDYAHAEGNTTRAAGANSHTEGVETSAIGERSHAEGSGSIAIGAYSHAEGYYTKTNSSSAHAEGNSTVAVGSASHAEGSGSHAVGIASHAEGSGSYAVGPGCHTEGISTTATSNYSHAEGDHTSANGEASHAEGYYSKSTGIYSHAEGTITEAKGYYSHSEGAGTIAEGQASHAEGNASHAYGSDSHTEGKTTITHGPASHSEGKYTITHGEASHAEGISTTAYVSASHAEGKYTITHGEASHAEGESTTTHGQASHAEGYSTTSHRVASHAEGNRTTAIGDGSHAEGSITTAEGSYSHAEGNSTKSIGISSHAEGSTTTAIGNYSHAEGRSTTAEGQASHAEGYYSKTVGYDSHAEGYYTKAIGNYSHAEGRSTTAEGESAHAEGYNSQSVGLYSHTEGNSTIAIGEASHAEGNNTIAEGQSSHAEGNNTKSIGHKSHAEGEFTIAKGYYSHSEGFYTSALGDASHAEGNNTIAEGLFSHTEGAYTKAVGQASHAEGHYTLSINEAEHAEGKCNRSNTGSEEKDKTISSIGIGESDTDRKNAFEVMQNGDMYVYGLGDYDGTNPTTATTLQTVINNLNGSSGTVGEIPVATDTVLGGIKLGYTESGSNLAVKLDNEKAHVTLSKTAIVSALGFEPGTGSGEGSGISITPGIGLTGTTDDSAITSSGTINLKQADSSELGGVKIGFTTNDSGKQYKLDVSDTGHAYTHVPWTDTKNTAGSNDTTEDLYIIGAQELGDNPQTYSHSEVKISGNAIKASGGFYQESDERLKDFTEDILVDLEQLSQLPKKHFTWKNDSKKETQIGTSAQELQKLYPELVKEDSNGTLSVAYDKLSIIALKAIDELYKRNIELERRIQELENK